MAGCLRLLEQKPSRQEYENPFEPEAHGSSTVYLAYSKRHVLKRGEMVRSWVPTLHPHVVVQALWLAHPYVAIHVMEQ